MSKSKIWRLAFLMALLLSLVSFTQAQTPSPTSTAPPEPVRVLEGANGVTLSLYFDDLPQGRAGYLLLTGDIRSARAFIFNREFALFPRADGRGYAGFIAANMDQARRDHELRVVYETPDTSATLTALVTVTAGGFIRQDVTLPPERAELVDESLEREEMARIQTLASRVRERRLWDDEGFRFPLDGELTSPFGAVRTFNETYETRHTGWDFQASIGQPMSASAAGQVVMAEWLPIRGHYVLIDHGQGIFSGYAHLSVMHVIQGQSVTQGQIIGQVGNTGRSSGPHAHVEWLVAGIWVDAAAFITRHGSH